MRTAEEYALLTERALERELRSLGDMPENLAEAMLYSLKAGGKRLRPVLLLAACELLGGSVEEALPFACALEMIHTYSLIHDDLPAMDNDDLRRGRPTSHKVFGEGLAILAGDGLLSAAMELMLKTAAARNDRRGLDAAYVIARRCGVTGMVGGQVVDVTGEGTEPTLEKVTYIHLHKTADLLTAPVEAGFILAGAAPEQLSLGVRYGRRLGIAFQMVDDLLDVVGDEKVLGKKTGMDAALGKLTWIAVRGIDGTREDAEANIHEAIAAMEALRTETIDPSFFTALARETLTRVK